jgi:hypothetical protein
MVKSRKKKEEKRASGPRVDPVISSVLYFYSTFCVNRHASSSWGVDGPLVSKRGLRFSEKAKTQILNYVSGINMAVLPQTVR